MVSSVNTQYILHPGFVTHKGSGMNKWVSPTNLARLYGVHMRDCLVLDYSVLPAGDKRAQEGYIHLYPDYHGDYDLVARLTDLATLESGG